MREITLFLLCGVAFSACVSVKAQEPVSQSERTEAFLTGKAQNQKNKAARLGNSSDLPGINGLVKAVSLKLPEPGFVDNPDQMRRLADSFLTDVAQELAQLGFKPGDIRAAKGNGRELVEAAAARVRGTASLQQQALLSDTLIVGRVTNVNERDDRNDGYLSTVNLTVQKSFSKGVGIGETLEFRRVSGETAAGRVTSSAEETLAVGDIILLVGSKAYYGNGKIMGQAKNAVVEILPFYRIDGDRLIPSSPFQQAALQSDLSIK